MGYSIYIGEAKAGIDFYEDEVYVYPDVDIVKLDYAPSFPNDELTGNSNYRAPSYSAWSDFLRGAGLYDMFFDKSEGLMREHPGCFIINENHLKKIQGAVKRRKEVSAKQPGFLGFLLVQVVLMRICTIRHWQDSFGLNFGFSGLF